MNIIKNKYYILIIATFIGSILYGALPFTVGAIDNNSEIESSSIKLAQTPKPKQQLPTTPKPPASSPTDSSSSSGSNPLESGLDEFKSTNSGLRENGTLLTYVASIVNYLLGLIGLAFFILVLYAGFKYMTARENAAQTKEAQTTIINGVIGMAIIFAAYLISDYVVTAVTK